MKVTKKQFNQFKKSFTDTCDRLGLTEYQITFNQDILEGKFASIVVDHEPCMAVVTLCIGLHYKLDKQEFNPIWLGKHEALHLLLAKFAFMAEYRSTLISDLDKEEHHIIRRLEKVL